VEALCKIQATQRVPTRTIFSGLATLSNEAIYCASTSVNMRKALVYKKSKLGDQRSLPRSINFDVPEEYQWTTSATRQPFLLIDSGKEDPERILGFTTLAFLRKLLSCQTIFGDGTFASVPVDGFYQLYSLHGEVSEECTVPLVFLLLKNKSAQTYTRMLGLVSQAVQGLEWSADCVTCDFEKAFIKAVNQQIPNAVAALCYFHMSQSIWRKVVELRLRNDYLNDPELRTLVNCLKSLCFVPLDDVEQCFDELSTSDWQHFEPLRQYFESTYIGAFKMTRVKGKASPVLQRVTPDYPIRTWNQFDQTMEGRQRTNNRIEAWNAAFHASLGCSRPNMWNLFKQFQVEANKTMSDLSEVEAGTYQRRKKPQYLRFNKTILTMCQTYQSFESKFDYLKKIAVILGSY
jgi:hypothetical protein